VSVLAPKTPSMRSVGATEVGTCEYMPLWSIDTDTGHDMWTLIKILKNELIEHSHMCHCQTPNMPSMRSVGVSEVGTIGKLCALHFSPPNCFSCINRWLSLHKVDRLLSLYGLLESLNPCTLLMIFKKKKKLYLSLFRKT
jgi:hypothetical protein